MSVFGRYAACYDLIYQDKDYASEVAFADAILGGGELAGGREVLELGCGTAGHAVLLAGHGYRVTGVDRSHEMLDQAAQRLASQPSSVAESISLVEGDIAKVNLGCKFDAALAFFHVVSYLTDNDTLSTVFGNVRQHLHPGGLFLFDYWHGPAVLALKPEVRIRTFEDDDMVVERTMQPSWLAECNCISIEIGLTVTDRRTGRSQQINETHVMRYFEPDELRLILEREGFRVRRSSAWLSNEAPSETSWGACLVAEAL